jgi:hypothetical protein
VEAHTDIALTVTADPDMAVPAGVVDPETAEQVAGAAVSRVTMV